jgi:hypothetical protein
VHLSFRKCVFVSALVIVLALPGCTRAPGPAPVAETSRLTCDPARLSLSAGDSAMLVARAEDAAGKPIEGARIHFGVSDPRALRVTVLGEVASLGPAGKTSIVITSGSQSLTVPVDVVAGPAHRFEATAVGPLEVVAGSPSEERASVRLLDAFDNPVANSRVMFEAAMWPPVSLTTVTGTDGVASFTLPVITRAGHFTLNVHTMGPAPLSGALDVQVDAASPATLEPVRVLPSGPVALVPDFELVLRVRDAFGNPVSNVLVGWRTDSRSTSFDPPQSRSEPDGLVRTRWRLTEFKQRRVTLRAFVVKNERIRFETWVALER